MKAPLSVMAGLLVAAAAMALVGCSKESRMERALARAERYFESGDWAEAQIEYLKVLREDVRNPTALSQLGILYHEQGRWSLAVPLLLEAARVTPENLEVRQRLEQLYLTAGRAADAREQARFILSRQPTNAEAVLAMADASVLPSDIEATRSQMNELKQLTGDRAVYHLAEAEFLMRSTNTTAAVAEARRGLEMDPQSAAGLVVLGNILLAQGDKTEAREMFERSYALAPPRSPRKFRWIGYLLENGETETARALLVDLQKTMGDYVPAIVYLARAELELKHLDECEKLLEKALTLDERNVETLSLVARLHSAQGKLGEAVRILERLAQASPSSPQIQYELAMARMRGGNLSAALTSLDRVSELRPGLLEPRLMAAQISMRLGDVPGALTELSGLLSRNPKERRVRLLLGEARRLSGNLNEAAAIYAQLLKEEPKDPEAGFRYGQILLLQGHPGDARQVFEKVLESAPDHLPSMTALAELDLRDKNLPASLSRAQEQARLHPNALGPKLLLAQIHLAMHSYDAAEKEFKAMIDQAPTWQPPYLALARLYTASNRVVEARSQLTTLLTNRPGDERALLTLALMDETQGHYQDAASRYERMLQDRPENVMVLNNLAYLNVRRLDNLDRALELVTKARELAPQEASVADTFGWVLLKRGEHRRALGVLREAAPQLGANAEFLFHLGVACYMNGQEAPARQYLEQASLLSKEPATKDEAASYLAVLSIPPQPSDAAQIRLLKETLQSRPADPVALPRLAAVLAARNDLAGQRALYEAALKTDSKSVPGLIGLAELSMTQPDGHARALELARIARAQAPNDPTVALLLGQVAFRAGDFSWALSLLEECAGKLPEQPMAYYDLALAYFSRGRPSDAEGALQKVEGKLIDPSALEAAKQFRQMLTLLKNLGDPTVAQQSAQSVLNKDPDNLAARMVIGWVAERSGKDAEARHDYEDLLRAYPQFVPAMRRMAILTSRHPEDNARAYDYCLKARAALPGDAELACSLGTVVYRRGDYRYAEQLLREGLSAQPGDVNALYHLGLAQFHLGEKVSSKQNLSKALERDPDNRLAAEARRVLSGS